MCTDLGGSDSGKLREMISHVIHITDIILCTCTRSAKDGRTSVNRALSPSDYIHADGLSSTAATSGESARSSEKKK